MIHTKKGSWKSIKSDHRRIRSSSIDSVPNNGEINLTENNLHAYLSSSESHLNELSNFFSASFDENYRRKSKEFKLKITKDLKVGAYVNKGENSSIVNITLGTLLSIEDANHALFSDPQTPLGRNIGETQIDRGVLKLPMHNFFDEFRYVNYDSIVNDIKVAQVENKTKTFILFLHKFLSASEFRRNLADLSSDIGLYWVFAHEEAHQYLGHLSYFEDSIKAYQNVEISFSELVANLVDQQYPERRRAAEFEADMSATVKVIDYFLDSDILEAYPFLNNGLFEHYNTYLPEGYTVSEIRTMYLLRIIINSISTVLSVFQRSIVKNNSDTSFYPNYLNRITNTILSAIGRAMINAKFQSQLNLSTLSEYQQGSLIYLLVYDLKAISRNFLMGDFLISDKEMNTMDNRQIISLLNEEPFDVSFVQFYTILFIKRGISLKHINNDKHLKFFIELTKNKCNCIDIVKRIFFKYRIKENPQLKEKIIEDVNEQSLTREYLEMILNLSL